MGSVPISLARSNIGQDCAREFGQCQVRRGGDAAGGGNSSLKPQAPRWQMVPADARKAEGPFHQRQGDATRRFAVAGGQNEGRNASQNVTRNMTQDETRNAANRESRYESSNVTHVGCRFGSEVGCGYESEDVGRCDTRNGSAYDSHTDCHHESRDVTRVESDSV
jgi:hypothetical protein